LATIQGAKALGVEHEIGSVETGKRADIILVDAKAPNMNPVYGPETVLSDLVYSASAANVHTTIVDGRVLMENRQVKSADVEEIVDKARELATKLARDSVRSPRSQLYFF